MSELPEIVGITLRQDDQETTWRCGDEVEINNPGHEDHGKLGTIVTFQILRADLPDSDDQGVVYPAVSVDTDATLFVIPFTKLTHKGDDK